MTDDEKVELLLQEYDGVDKEALTQVFLACDKSLKQTRSLLDQSFERRKAPKRSLYQSSITSMVGATSTKKHKQDSNISQQLAPARSKSQEIIIYNQEQIEEHLHPFVSIHKGILPKDSSDKILKYFLQNKYLFETRVFYLFDQLCQSHSKLAFFYKPKGFNKDASYYNGEANVIYEFNDEIEKVADTITEYVNKKIVPKYTRLPFQPKDYEVSGCIVNYYEELSSNLGWHSDRLQAMGPHNFIVSLSLGSTRVFRLKRHSNPHITYSIHLPHNCLLVMHPGCQELFKHCVTAMKKPLQLHPICGLQRFNMTFRYFPEEFTANVPKCKCKIPMLLRRSFKSPEDESFGKYFWTCENSYRNKDCHTFHWADFSNKDDNFIAEDDSKVSIWKCT